jgi:signal transduction histidine kinase
VIEAGQRVLRFEQRPLLADESDRVVGTIVLLEDRTAEQAALRQQYEYVCRALHDVRVPLQAVGGAAEGLLRGWFGPLADEQREFVAMIKENAGRQGDLFSSLFDVYTLSAGHAELHTERVRLEGVLHEVAHELAPRFAARTLDLALEIEDELPPVEAERRRLRQVLAALLDNACKYTLPPGSVVVRAFRQGGELRVDVQDTGVGIRAADQPRIFEPFFRGESPLKEGRYGGLSLAIARMLAELHGGRMWFESAEGQGSTFSFALPVAPGA